jgi:hypothetical protein
MSTRSVENLLANDGNKGEDDCINLEWIINDIEKERRKAIVVKKTKYWVNGSVPELNALSLEVLYLVDKDGYVKEFQKLFEKGSNNDLLTALMTLDKLFEVDKELFWDYLERGIKHTNKRVRVEAAKRLSYLQRIDLDLYEKKFNEILGGSDIELSEHIVRGIGFLIKDNYDIYLRLLDKALAHPNQKIKKAVARIIGGIAEKDINRYLELYNQGMENSSQETRAKTAFSIGHVAKTNLRLYLELFEKGIEHADYNVKERTVRTLVYLMEYDQKKYLEIMDKEFDNPKPDLKELYARTIFKLAELNMEEFLNVFNKWMTIPNQTITTTLLTNLTNLAKYAPDEYYKIYEEYRKKTTDINTIKLLTKSTEGLVEGDPEKYLEIYMHQLISDGKLSIPTPTHLKALALTLKKDNIRPIEDSEFNFIRLYLKSKYARTREGKFKPAEAMMHELRKIVNNEYKNYVSMSKLVEIGKANDINQLIALASFDAKETFLEELGRGVAGKTYLVYSPEADGNMAMKIVKDEFYNPKEARILNGLADNPHKNIVQIKYSGNHIVKRYAKPVYAILMEYVDGETLDDIMKKNKEGLGIDTALDYSYQLVDGLDYLKKNKVFHRDIHLKNVKINSKGILKVIDFGIATDRLDDPPKDNRKYGGESDIVSWALVTYKLITGKHLVYNQDKKINSEEYANEIRRLKGMMRDESGGLIELYKNKITQNVPEELRGLMIMAIENKSEDEKIDKQDYIKRNFKTIKHLEQNKEKVESIVGRQLSIQEYYAITRAIEG